MGTDAQARFEKAEEKRKKADRKAKHKAKVKAVKEAQRNKKENREVDRLEAATRASEEVAALMRDNVALAMANVDDLGDMEMKSRKLTEESRLFEKESRGVRKRACCQYWSARLLCLTVCLIVLAVVGVIIGVKLS